MYYLYLDIGVGPHHAYKPKVLDVFPQSNPIQPGMEFLCFLDGCFLLHKPPENPEFYVAVLTAVFFVVVG